MFSNFVKIALIWLGFSPVLLVLYSINLHMEWKELRIYTSLDSFAGFWEGTRIFLGTHYLLLLFISIVILFKRLLHIAVKKLPTGAITAKSIKPADQGYFTMVFSILLPFFKTMGLKDGQFLAGFFIATLLYGLMARKAHHYNLILKIIFRYMSYEVQTTGEITYLVLSKEKLVNRKQLTDYVYLTDYMIINVSKAQ